MQTLYLSRRAFNALIYSSLTVLTTIATAQTDLVPPQCDPSMVLDIKNIAFMGPVKFIQAGTVNFSYHEFGPLDLSDIYPLPLPPAATAPSPSAGTTMSTTTQHNSNRSASISSTAAPILFIHGFASTQYEWPLDLLENVAASRRVIIFDNPRIGLSSDSSTQLLTIEYMANATLNLIQSLSLQRPDIVGYSMGGDVALMLATQHAEAIGSVVAIAASYGGPSAPQPPGGIKLALDKLQALMLSKYSTSSNPSPSMASFASSVDPGSKSSVWTASPFSYSSKAQSTSNDTDQSKLLFPLGSLDPAACYLLRDYFSLSYAIGLLPIDNYSGYALPGFVFPEGVISTPFALIPTQEALQQQSTALVQYHTQKSTVAPSLFDIDRQIMFMSGVQDNVIPITTQLESAKSSPGAWLIQIAGGGHGVIFLQPDVMAAQITSFLDASQDIGPTTRNYYYQSATSNAAMVAPFFSIFWCYMIMIAFRLNDSTF